MVSEGLHWRLEAMFGSRGSLQITSMVIKHRVEWLGEYFCDAALSEY